MTIGELIAAIRTSSGTERAQLENIYWGIAASKYGPHLAHHYREEYEWLKANSSHTTSP